MQDLDSADWDLSKPRPESQTAVVQTSKSVEGTGTPTPEKFLDKPGKPAEKFEEWFGGFEEYLVAAELESNPERFKVALFKMLVDKEAVRILGTYGCEFKTPEEVKDLMHFNPVRPPLYYREK